MEVDHLLWSLVLIDVAVYTYPLLQPRHIRVLELQTSGLDTGIFQGKFIVAPIDDKVQYDALSYIWGDPVSTDIVHVPGGTILIAANLADALRCFRRHSRLEPLRIWADAICI
jgi:hypothetical protein